VGQSNKILKQHIGKAGTQAAVQKEEKYSWRMRFDKNWESTSGEWPGVLVSGDLCSMGGQYAKRKTRPDGTGNDYYKQRVFVLTTLGNPVRSGLRSFNEPIIPSRSVAVCLVISGEKSTNLC
jgi:hypothetical protein